MREVFAVAIASSIVLVAPEVLAFCQTTICDERYTCEQKPDICCVRDARGCDVNTPVITWPTNCVSFNVHEDGSDKRDISASELADILDTAFDQWLSVDCNGDTVSLAVEYRGLAECGDPEYNQEKRDRNANVWMFRDRGTNTHAEQRNGAVGRSACRHHCQLQRRYRRDL